MLAGRNQKPSDFSALRLYNIHEQVKRGAAFPFQRHDSASKNVEHLTPMTKNSTCVPGGLFVTHSRKARLMAAARNGQASPQSVTIVSYPCGYSCTLREDASTAGVRADALNQS